MIMVMEQLLYEKTLKKLELLNLEKKGKKKKRMMDDKIKSIQKKKIKAVDKMNEELLFITSPYKS